MKKINYFDLGLHLGQELDWFVNGIFPELKIDNYTAHGFEACEEYCSECENKYNNHPKVNIHHLAISNKNEPVKLYYSEHPMGHSVFDSKKNIRQSKEFEEVQGIKFSDWLRSNVPDFEQDINMIKINIEGAEWYLINDMVENDMVKDFDIFFG